MVIAVLSLTLRKSWSSCALVLALSVGAKALSWSPHPNLCFYRGESRATGGGAKAATISRSTSRKGMAVALLDSAATDSDYRDETESRDVEVVLPEDEELLEDELDWIPDRVKARALRLENRIPVFVENDGSSELDDGPSSKTKDRPSAYTEEEEDIIESMGGKTKASRRRREMGYLGDSTLREIAMDYSVPVCYLADVLCMWGVMPPIPIDDVPLGDMVTGEQAFAILEAVNSLDMGALNDRYSNTSVRQLCIEYDMNLQDAFSMAMKEGWSLPFGVESCLRVEQEDELLRVLRHEGSLMTTDNLDNGDYDDYEFGDAY